MEASQQQPQPQPQPQSEQPATTDDLLRQVLAEQQQHRAEVAALRDQINASKPPAPPASQPQSLEERFKARMEAIAKHSHYCPACGLLYDYQQRCTGRAEAGHPPVEVVSTDELKSGDPEKHSEATYV